MYIKIFGRFSYFSKFTKCQLLIWSGTIFNQTQLKNWLGVSFRVANSLSLNFSSSVFGVKNLKPNIWGLVVQNLPSDKSPNMKWRIFQLINKVEKSASSSVRHLSGINWSSLSLSVVISSPCSGELLPWVPLSVDRSEDVDSLQEYAISWFLSIKKKIKNLLLH